MEYTMENTLPNTSRTIFTTHAIRSRGRQQFSLGVSFALPEEDRAVDTLEELLNQTWSIFCISTLFNFHQDEVHLKMYAKRLREEVAGSLAQEDVTYNAKVFVLNNGITRPSPMDPPPIKIEVYAKNNSREDSVEKCIYKGILLSWRTTKNELAAANSIRLPLLLCRGTQGTTESVHKVLGHMFDCMVIALAVKEDDLIWLVPILITPTNREEQPKDTDEIRLEYRIPELPKTDTITVKFQVLDLIKILTVIIKDQSDDASVEISFNLEHIEKFRDVLYTQMLETAGLQLGLCTLYKISLPAFAIAENKMKVTNTETMNRVLLYLNEKALDTFHTLNFDV